MAASRVHPHPVVDVDSHVYEPETIWTDYLQGEGAQAARDAFSVVGEVVLRNGQPVPGRHQSKINRHAVWRPGMTPDDIGRLDPQHPPASNPGAWEPGARLADLDELGIDQQVVFPTLFGEHFPVVEDAAAAVALARAYNDWAHDLAGAGHGRLHPVAVLPLQDVDAALDELTRVAERGCRGVLLRPMFYRVAGEAHGSLAADGASARSGQAGENPNGVFIDHEAFQPVWRRLEELGVVACVHPYLGITNAEGTSEGSYVERVSEKLGIGHTVAEAVAYMQDTSMFTVVAMFHGLLEDYPSLKLALLHSGASMLPLSLEKAETYLWLSPSSIFATANPVCLEPEEVFQRSRAVVGLDGWESSPLRLLDFFATKAAWGSRYPHHDASTPHDMLTLCEQHHVPDEVVARLLGGNAADLFGLELPVAAR